jgi:hypothetical protein
VPAVSKQLRRWSDSWAFSSSAAPPGPSPDRGGSRRVPPRTTAARRLQEDGGSGEPRVRPRRLGSAWWATPERSRGGGPAVATSSLPGPAPVELRPWTRATDGCGRRRTSRWSAGPSRTARSEWPGRPRAAGPLRRAHLPSRPPAPPGGDLADACLLGGTLARGAAWMLRQGRPAPAPPCWWTGRCSQLGRRREAALRGLGITLLPGLAGGGRPRGGTARRVLRRLGPPRRSVLHARDRASAEVAAVVRRSPRAADAEHGRMPRRRSA